MPDQTKPIHEEAFDNSRVVICGWCNGHKTIGEKPCPKCDGEGILHRVAKGTVKLFKVK